MVERSRRARRRRCRGSGRTASVEHRATRAHRIERRRRIILGRSRRIERTMFGEVDHQIQQLRLRLGLQLVAPRCPARSRLTLGRMNSSTWLVWGPLPSSALGNDSETGAAGARGRLSTAGAETSAPRDVGSRSSTLPFATDTGSSVARLVDSSPRDAAGGRGRPSSTARPVFRARHDRGPAKTS